MLKITIPPQPAPVPEPEPKPRAERSTPVILSRSGDKGPEKSLRESLKSLGSSGGSGSTAVQLGVAWINGSFTAVAMNRGEHAGTWTSPEPVADPAAFAAALRNAAAQTGFSGNQVTLILAHARLGQRFIEVPAQKSAQSQKALARQVDQGKSFSGPARWVAQETLPTKSSGGTMVHVLPAEFVDELVTAAERAGLNLSCIVPATEAVRELVGLTGEPKDHTVLLASALPNATQLVLVDGAGTPLLFRSVAESWSRDPARVAMDIHRTLQFVQQQFDRSVNGVWLHGPQAGIAVENMAAQMPVPIQVLSAPQEELFWADAAARISSNHPLNLVSRDQKQAPQRRVMVRFSLALSLVVMLGALGIAGYVHRLHGQATEMLARLKKDEAALKARYETLQSEYQKVAREESFLKAVGDNRQAPVHAWFLGYLSEALPMELLVTNVTARIQTNRWQFQIHGQAQPALQDRGERGFPAAIEKFTNALATGPIPIAFDAGGGGAAASGPAGQGTPSEWATRLRSAPAGTPRRPGFVNFSLEGVLQ